MAKKFSFVEEEKKENMVAADEAAKKAMQSEESAEKKEEEKCDAKEEGNGEKDPETDPEHADIEKDKALILAMIKKYMSAEDEEESEEALEAAHKAYEAYKEMGEEEDEAIKFAGKAMKLAKHMAGKRMKADEAEKCEAEEKKEVVPMTPKADPEHYVAKKESEIKLTARVAFLERELKKRELSEAMDKHLRESGLGRAETDKIRALIGEAKSEAQILETIKIFKRLSQSRAVRPRRRRKQISLLETNALRSKRRPARSRLFDLLT
jgi:translation initiation factor IF-2